MTTPEPLPAPPSPASIMQAEAAVRFGRPPDSRHLRAYTIIFEAEMTVRRTGQTVTTRTCPDCMTDGHDAAARYCKHCGKPLPAYRHD